MIDASKSRRIKMSDFWKWLQEAKKENKPQLVGFICQYVALTDPNDQHSGYETIKSEILKTYHDAVEKKRDIFEKTKNISAIYAVYSDKTMRPIATDIGGAGWHLNRAGRLIPDYQVDNNGRGKTNHGYLAGKDNSLKIYNTLAYLKHELRPGNMPKNSGETIDPEFWKLVNAALDKSTKELSLWYMAELHDYIKENYDVSHEAVDTALMLIKQALRSTGMFIPEG
jgi:hypothetical protein